MPSNYDRIRADNQRKYGTDIGRIGPMLLANRYDDRTHFVFELLQNAEDALRKRKMWGGRKSVTFDLLEDDLRVSHFGKPFDEPDVRGICGIDESVKEFTDIGRFGIGFKSVYAITDCPEVYSGDEHFAIESFVWPKAMPPIEMEPDETVFRLPLRDEDHSELGEIASGLRRLGPRTLLFLRETEEVSWTAIDGTSGLYLRSKPEPLGEHARKVSVIGQAYDTDGVTEETWLIFAREVLNDDDVMVGYVEIAFALWKGDQDAGFEVRSVSSSPLVVSFPTIVQTNLGFLVQGPYRTTPSRDNVPFPDAWNKHLVEETAELLIEALQELKNLGLLNVAALRSLPLDASKFPEDRMFAPLFSATLEALVTLPLLPRFGGGHITAQQAKLARTQELRDLIDPAQLTALFQSDQELAWLSEDITQDRTPELRHYLMEELDIAEVVPETLLPRLTKPFLEAQADDWIVRLYEFLHGQSALLRRLSDVPVVRLEDGSHVAARKDDEILAFLPGKASTGFPTVRRTICQSEEAVVFLYALGLTEPDPVDDVIANLLPKYQGEVVDVQDDEYQEDIGRLLAAFSTDSNAQRTKLVTALRSTSFVLAVDADDGTRRFVQPTEAYQATQRLKDLFDGVPGILMVDDSCDCLRGEQIRNLLEASGSPLYLLPIGAATEFTSQQLLEMRRSAGYESISYEQGIDDTTLRGLDELVPVLCQLPEESARTRATLLWEALCDVVSRRATGSFFGEYRWFWYTDRSARFDADFVKLLNETAWIPDNDGTLRLPEQVVFEDIDPRWEPNLFLLSRIGFKPPFIDQLAKEVGIEPGVLDLLKKLGLISVEKLRELGITDDVSQGNGQQPPGELSPEEAISILTGSQPQPTPPAPSPPEGPVGTEVNGSAGGQHGGTGSPPNGGGPSGGRTGGQGGPGPVGQTGGSKGQGGKSAAGGRKFVSYVAVAPDDDGPDPDGLEHQERLALEDQAIDLILSHEPGLNRTPTNNPGFDLSQPGVGEQPVKWVEVKAMKGTLHDRSVGLSSTQFECAQEHGEAYWLYVVEQAGSPEDARIVRIQDPAGKAQTFTFDQGWTAVSEITESVKAQRQD